MIERTTRVDMISIDRLGNMNVLLALEVTDAGQVLARQNHRTVVDQTVSVAQQFAAVNAHLVSMGWPEVSVSDLARLRRFNLIEGKG